MNQFEVVTTTDDVNLLDIFFQENGTFVNPLSANPTKWSNTQTICWLHQNEMQVHAKTLVFVREKEQYPNGNKVALSQTQVKTVI